MWCPQLKIDFFTRNYLSRNTKQMTQEMKKVAPHKGKLLILLPGMGAVGTTCIAGVESIRRGLSKPIGSLTQMQTIRIGKRSENRQPLIRDFVDLAPLADIEFAGWDVFPDDAHNPFVVRMFMKMSADPCARANSASW
jgi:myo-inositol-1-phosphate synthase